MGQTIAELNARLLAFGVDVSDMNFTEASYA
jgi:hypothetical protein